MMKVDLQAELRKCSLLRDCNDTRALRGLLAVWQGTLPANSEGEAIEQGLEFDAAPLEDDSSDRTEPWWKQQSGAYPENLIPYGEPFDGAPYLRIPVNSTLELPALPCDRPVVFLLSTNARRINASLSGPGYVLLNEGSLDELQGVDETKLANPAPWRKFLATVRENVSVQFLFTRGD
jgi:hypothetical protein